MTSLLDISPVGEQVDVAGRKMQVRGVGLTEILHLLGRFPHLRKLFDGGGLTWESLFPLLADATGPIIAAGCGHFGEEDHEAAGARLDPDTALTLLIPILRLTMPNGAGPFVDRVRGMIQLLEGGNSAPDKDTGSKPSRSSPKPSKA